MKSQYALLIIIVLTVLIGLFAQQTLYQNVYDIEINGKALPRSLKAVRVVDEVLYIEVFYLEGHTELEASVKESEKEITITHNEKSVNFRIEKEEAFKKGKRYFVSLRKLLEELGGRYVWDKDNKILIIDF